MVTITQTSGGGVQVFLGENETEIRRLRRETAADAAAAAASASSASGAVVVGESAARSITIPRERGQLSFVLADFLGRAEFERLTSGDTMTGGAIGDDVFTLSGTLIHEDGAAIEPGTTQLWGETDDFTYAGWYQTYLTRGATFDGPNGALTKLIPTTDAAQAKRFSQNEDAVSGTTYCISCEARAGEYEWVVLSFPSAAFGNTSQIGFNLVTGEWLSPTPIYPVDGYHAEEISEGVWRVSAWKEATITVLASFSIYPVEAASAPSDLTAAGDGTSGVYIGNPNLTTGPGVRALFINSGTSAQVRSDVLLSYDLSGLPDNDRWTDEFIMAATGIEIGDTVFWSRGDGNTDEAISVSNVDGEFTLSVNAGGVSQGTATGPAITAGLHSIRIGTDYAAQSVRWWVNDVEQTAINPATMPAAATETQLADGDGVVAGPWRCLQWMVGAGKVVAPIAETPTVSVGDTFDRDEILVCSDGAGGVYVAQWLPGGDERQYQMTQYKKRTGTPFIDGLAHHGTDHVLRLGQTSFGSAIAEIGKGGATDDSMREEGTSNYWALQVPGLPSPDHGWMEQVGEFIIIDGKSYAAADFTTEWVSGKRIELSQRCKVLDSNDGTGVAQFGWRLGRWTFTRGKQLWLPYWYWIDTVSLHVDSYPGMMTSQKSITANYDTAFSLEGDADLDEGGNIETDGDWIGVKGDTYSSRLTVTKGFDWPTSKLFVKNTGDGADGKMYFQPWQTTQNRVDGDSDEFEFVRELRLV